MQAKTDLVDEWELWPMDWRIQALEGIGLPRHRAKVMSSLRLPQVLSSSSLNEGMRRQLIKTLLEQKAKVETRYIDLEFSDGKTRRVPFVEPMRPMERAGKALPKDAIAEEKKDGSLTLQYVEDDAVAYVNRRGVNKTAIYPELCDDEPRRLKQKGLSIIQGEVYALKGGTDSFEAFLKRDLLQNPEEARRRRKLYPLKFGAFDLVANRSKMLVQLPLHRRKALLAQRIPRGMPDEKVVSFSRHPVAFAAEKRRDPTVEGVIYKDLRSPYASGKNRAWMKEKFVKHADVMITGYYKGGRSGKIGGFTAAIWNKNKGQLIGVGRVGTGFTEDQLKDIKRKLDRGEEVFARVEYLKVGSQGRLRAAAYKGLRTDIVKEDTHV